MIMTAAQNVPALRQFYEQGLGWTAWGPASNMSVLYKVGTSILVFLNADYQAQESGLLKADGVKSIWAIFVESKAAVDRDFQQAIDAGATVTSPVRDRDMGLYSGYFARRQWLGSRMEPPHADRRRWRPDAAGPMSVFAKESHHG
ncbi:VOC family protein [Sphingobium sp. Z007]|nr:hypothetical protein [Sphingobium sp. Z007]